MGDGWVRRDPKTGNYQKKSWLDELAESCGAEVIVAVALGGMLLLEVIAIVAMVISRVAS